MDQSLHVVYGNSVHEHIKLKQSTCAGVLSKEIQHESVVYNTQWPQEIKSSVSADCAAATLQKLMK